MREQTEELRNAAEPFQYASKHTYVCKYASKHT